MPCLVDRSLVWIRSSTDLSFPGSDAVGMCGGDGDGDGDGNCNCRMVFGTLKVGLDGWVLGVGCWLLVVGCWLVVGGWWVLGV